MVGVKEALDRGLRDQQADRLRWPKACMAAVNAMMDGGAALIPAWSCSQAMSDQDTEADLQRAAEREMALERALAIANREVVQLQAMLVASEARNKHLTDIATAIRDAVEAQIERRLREK